MLLLLLFAFVRKVFWTESLHRILLLPLNMRSLFVSETEFINCLSGFSCVSKLLSRSLFYFLYIFYFGGSWLKFTVISSITVFRCYGNILPISANRSRNKAFCWGRKSAACNALSFPSAAGNLFGSSCSNLFLGLDYFPYYFSR